MINSLSAIGWADLQGPKEAPKEAPSSGKPAKKTDKKLAHAAACDAEYADHAYPKYKYQTDYIPICLFKPTDEVLLKIIRAATFITKEEDFIFD
jgi:hypothetical protein